MNGTGAGGSRECPRVVNLCLKETTSDPKLIPRLQHALKSKEKEVEQLKQRLIAKDRAITSLESVTQNQLNENARLHRALSLERKQGEKLKVYLEIEKKKRDTVKKMLALTHDVLIVALTEMEEDEQEDNQGEDDEGEDNEGEDDEGEDSEEESETPEDMEVVQVSEAVWL